MKKQNYELTVGWLYPELMSTYGDRGNIIVLQKRIEWRGMGVKIKRINHDSKADELISCDILFMGGAQDIQQEIVQKDLNGTKGKIISKLIESNTPGLFICGAYQFLGNYYIDSYGIKIPGLGIFDMYTHSDQAGKRLIGNAVIKPHQLPTNNLKLSNYIVGFENHGGRTILANKDLAFAEIIKGYGNNGEDTTEGIHYKSTIGTYLHGPILPSNPELADYLIENALVKKYGKEIALSKLDDTYANKAKTNILMRLKTSY